VPCSGAAPHGTSSGLCVSVVVAVVAVSETSARDCAQQSQSTSICASRCAQINFFCSLALDQCQWLARDARVACNPNKPCVTLTAVTGHGECGSRCRCRSPNKPCVTLTAWPWTHGECGHAQRSLDHSHSTQLPHLASDWEHLAPPSAHWHIDTTSLIWRLCGTHSLPPHGSCCLHGENRSRVKNAAC
jgi:hypothetical protein